MKLLFIAVALFLTIITTVQAEPLISQEEMLEKIVTSINTEPQYWINSGNKLIYAESEEDIKHLRSMSWPEHDSKAKIVLGFHIGHYFNYVNVEKPFKIDLKGPIEEKILTEIKIYILKELQADVGHLIKKEEPVVEVKPELKEPQAKTISEGDKL